MSNLHRTTAVRALEEAEMWGGIGGELRLGDRGKGKGWRCRLVGPCSLRCHSVYLIRAIDGLNLTVKALLRSRRGRDSRDNAVGEEAPLLW